MEAGILGLPNVGKSTLFNALTAAGAEASNYPFCTIEPNTGIVKVPDPRLEIIRSHIQSKELLPAILKIVDIAGIVRGASKGEGLGNKFLSHIREVDALLHVVRCFTDENVTHVDGSVDPIRDIETIETELLLADLETVENALLKIKKQAKGADKDAQKKQTLLLLCENALKEGTPIRAIDIPDPEDRNILKTFSLLTNKKILYVANVDENDLAQGNPHTAKVQAYAQQHGGNTILVCAKIESELAELEPQDQLELLTDLGMQEPALNIVIRATYQLLGLQSYFTAGPKEIRAWTIPIGATAPQAAGVIHTDFERGFIRAEIYSVTDLQELKTETEIRAKGKMRIEGKTYIMQDSDIVHFLFNV